MQLGLTRNHYLGGLQAWLLAGGSYKSPQKPISKDSTSVQLSSSTPSDASGEIDVDFAGLAFEEASFVRYAQDDDGNINEFSTNLMEAIYSRTGGKPIIRLGGTSADYGKYLPGQTEAALPVAEQDNYQDVGHTTIGPSYWQLTKNFPDAVYMVQVPLATTNISEPIAWTQAAVDVIGLDQIHSIQPGNEPDLYSDTFTGEDGIELNPPDYQGTLTNETYVGNYTEYAAAIKGNVSEIPDGRFFTAFDVSTSFGADVVAEQYILAVKTCFELGIDDGDYIKEVSHHYYQGQSGTAETLATTLMDMDTTHTHLDQYKVHIDYLNANQGGLPFILNEVGNSLNPTNNYEYQARLGSALWQVDFYLYSMVIGVARINYQQIMHSGFDMWLPVASAGLPAQVFSNYYSQPFIGDFIGTSGQTRVSMLDTGDQDNVAAYAAYDNGTLSRIAVVNLNYWNETSSGTSRGSTTFDLAGFPDGTESLQVYKLSSPAGAGGDASNITYGGSQWTYDSLGVEVKDVRNDTETITVSGDSASVTVEESSAVLIWL